MSEGKKREYLRKTCKAKVEEFVKRAVEINTDKADYHYYNKIKDIILFGSLINTDRPKVHDIDLLVIYDYEHGLLEKFHKEHYGRFNDWFVDCDSERELRIMYLKNKCGIFSVHGVSCRNGQFRDDDEEYLIATSDKHIYLMKDYVEVPGFMELIP